MYATMAFVVNKPNQQPTTVLFDFDGTIAQTLHLLLYLPQELLRLTALEEITHAEIDFMRKHGIRKFIKLLQISPLRLPKVLAELQSLFARHIQNIPPVEGIAEVIESLQSNQVKIGIITSNTRENVEQYLEFHQLNLFSFIYSDKSVFRKHRVIEKVLVEQAIDKRTACYVGDETRDITAARKCQIGSVGVTWGFNDKARMEKMKPDWLLTHPRELLQFATAQLIQN